MRIATWNIYWLGDRDRKGNIKRSESDYELIARVIRQFAPDVLALARNCRSSADGTDSQSGKWRASRLCDQVRGLELVDLRSEACRAQTTNFQKAFPLYKQRND